MLRPGPLLVTGAGKGIGLASSIEAARRGWEVCATVHSPESVADVHRAAEAAKVQLRVEVLDLHDAALAREIVEDVEPYGLLNNAGHGSPGAIEDVDVDSGRAMLDLMSVAPMRLSQLSLPYMRAYGGGRIVNISSLAGRTSAPLVGWYVASKHALESLSDALRMEVARDSVSVSLVEPGGVDTGLFDKSIATAPDGASRFDSGYKWAARYARVAQLFSNTPEHLARVIVDILDSEKPKARYVVGLDARLMLVAGRVTPLPLRDRVKRKMLAL